jgi:hypothetical protein
MQRLSEWEGAIMDFTLDDAKTALREILEEELGMGRCELAPKWVGGTLLLQPFDAALRPKEVPLNVFFKKITSVREKLRVLEQKLNNHPTLSATEKAELQQLITRAYGSLTTFNVLFRDEADRFSGVKGSEE